MSDKNESSMDDQATSSQDDQSSQYTPPPEDSSSQYTAAPPPEPTSSPATPPQNRTPSQNPSLSEVGQSAEESGISSTASPTDVATPCDPQTSPLTYDQCYLTELLVQLDDGGANSFSVRLTQERRREPVADTVYERYKGNLRSYDLVMETVTGLSSPGSTKIRAASVTAQAYAGASHSGGSPHPRTSIDSSEAYYTHVQAAVHAENRYLPQGGWLALWPFQSSRAKEHPVVGAACGYSSYVSADSAPVFANLSVLVVSYPSLEVTMTITDTRRKGGTWSAAQNALKQEAGSLIQGARTVVSKLDGDGMSRTTSTVTKESEGYQQRSQSTTTTVPSAMGEGRKTTTEKRTGTLTDKDYVEEDSYSKSNAGPLKVETFTVTDTNSANDGMKTEVKESEKWGEFFSVSVASGGTTTTFKTSEINDIIDMWKKVDGIIKTLQALFHTVELGWTVSVDYTLFKGSLSLQWGMRWPGARLDGSSRYADNNRVYYVERFVTIGGDMKIVEGTVTGTLGLKFDKSWMPVAGTAQVVLAITAGVTVSPKIGYAYTNPNEKTTGHASAECGATVSLAFNLSLVGNLRVFGASWSAVGSAEASVKASIKMVFDAPDPPALVASVISRGVMLTGYVENTMKEPPRRSFTPITLIGPSEIMKERNLWA